MRAGRRWYAKASPCARRRSGGSVRARACRCCGRATRKGRGPWRSPRPLALALGAGACVQVAAHPHATWSGIRALGPANEKPCRWPSPCALTLALGSAPRRSSSHHHAETDACVVVPIKDHVLRAGARDARDERRRAACGGLLARPSGRAAWLDHARRPRRCTQAHPPELPPCGPDPTTTGRNPSPRADHWPQPGPHPGAENAAYVSPQPAAEAPSEEQRARNKAREAEPVAQRETPGGAMFVFCCNGRGCVFCDRF